MRNIAAKFFDNASRLSYELGLHGEKKKISGNFGIL